MVRNLEKDLYVGAKVHCDVGSKYDGIVEILEILEENVTFITNGVLCSSYKCLVKYEDGFTTKRTIKYIVDTEGDKVPEKYIDRYTYNLEKPYILEDEFPEDFGGLF